MSVSALGSEDATVAEPNDAELVQAAIKGNKNAYAALYDRYAPLVRAICYDHTPHLADAQDLTQDVFLRAYVRLDRLHRPERFGPWIVTMARLRCREWRRQRSRERRRHAGLDAIDAAAERPPDAVEPDALRKRIAQLPEKERLVLHVFYLQGNSTPDSCRLVGLSRSGFYRALDRARKQLRTLLARELEDMR
jgi:RNA polymerase sigma-70 factor (ECF subfamily)